MQVLTILSNTSLKPELFLMVPAHSAHSSEPQSLSFTRGSSLLLSLPPLSLLPSLSISPHTHTHTHSILVIMTVGEAQPLALSVS